MCRLAAPAHPPARHHCVPHRDLKVESVRAVAAHVSSPKGVRHRRPAGVQVLAGSCSSGQGRACLSHHAAKRTLPACTSSPPWRPPASLACQAATVGVAPLAGVCVRLRLGRQPRVPRQRRHTVRRPHAVVLRQHRLVARAGCREKGERGVQKVVAAGGTVGTHVLPRRRRRRPARARGHSLRACLSSLSGALQRASARGLQPATGAASPRFER